MNRVNVRLLILAALFFLLFGAVSQDQPPAFDWPIPGGKIGKAGKDLHVLPYDDLFELVSFMEEIQNSLRVACVYCHNLDDFAVDDPRANRSLHKNAARTMIRAVLNINEYMQKDRFVKKAVGPLLFGARDLKEPDRLAAKLQDAKDPLSQYLLERLSEDTRGLLREYDGSGPLSKSFREALVEDLNRLLNDPRLYDAQRFAHVKLTDQTRSLVADSPHGKDLARLNRLLLEEAYPSEITKACSVSCFTCHRGNRLPSQAEPSAELREP